MATQAPTFTTAIMPGANKPDDGQPKNSGYPAGIVAKPLRGRQSLTVISKNQNLSFRWGNRVASGGQRLGELEVMGFRFASPADCSVPGCAPKDNRFVYGDVILMCIDKTEYLGALKYNEQNALGRMSRKAHEKQGLSLLNTALSDVPEAPALKKKISLFSPTDEEAARLTGQ